MTIGITGPRRRALRRGAVAALVLAMVVAIALIVLGLTGDFLVDWLWFSAIGYLHVFWTTIVAEAEVFSAVFLATAIILWVNGSFASRFARSPWTQHPADFEWKRTGLVTLPDVLEFMRYRLPWPIVIAGSAGVLAVLVAWGEVHNWGLFLQFLYQVPYGANDPLYDKDIGFYLFSLPAYVAMRNWMLLTLFLSALFAGAVYWVRRLAQQKSAGQIILFEEPEAHLHPQLQLTLYKALNELPFQSILTRHSTNITANADLYSYVVLTGRLEVAHRLPVPRVA